MSSALPSLPPPGRPALMRIGTLSRRTGRSAHTIRWYESQRLIPGVRRDLQGRRVYHERHVEWLELLEHLRRSGMSIRDVREYAVLVRRGEASIKERHQLMVAHRRRVEAQMEQLHQALGILDRKINFYGEWLKTGVKPPTAFPPRRR